jgi:2-dehydro-3-deoxygluconokinase
MTAPRLDLLGLGECMVELFAEGPLGSAPHLRRGFGGDVLNALVAAARLGARCGFITRVGNDPFGAAMREAWAGEGIDVTHAALERGDNGVYFISVSDTGEREVSYRRAGSPASRLTPADIVDDCIGSSRMLLLSGITQALSASARGATLAAAQAARRLGVTVAYDPNYRPSLWAEQGGLAAARQAFDELVPFVGWLLPSHPADTVLMGQMPAATPDGDLDAAEAALRAFARACPQVALKLGPQGCLLHARAQTLHVEGQHVAHVRDTTGAGDLWNGSFLTALGQGRSPADAAALAHRLAALKLAYRGAIPPRAMYEGLHQRA